MDTFETQTIQDDLENQENKLNKILLGLDYNSIKQMIEHKNKMSNLFKENKKIINLEKEKLWMKKSGKKNLIKYSDDYILKIKSYFDQLDTQKEGSISIEQLTDPFVTWGICKNKNELYELFDEVVDKKKGINLQEFLCIVQGNNTSIKKKEIINFFKDLTSGKISNFKISHDSSFNLIISSIRRKKLIDMLMNETQKPKIDTNEILDSYKALLKENKNKISEKKHKKYKNKIFFNLN